jgi:molecular chaperone DnaJ
MEGLQPGFDAKRAREFKRWTEGGRGFAFSAGGPGGARMRTSGAGSFSDILGEMFGAFGGRGRGVPGPDLEYPLRIDLLDAVRGAEVAVTVPQPGPCPVCEGSGQSGGRMCPRCEGTGAVEERVRLTVKIPPGVDTGSRVRVAGKGGRGEFGGPPGDLYIAVTVTPHPLLERRGRDLYLDVPITVGEALRGATITVPTPEGKVQLRVPPGTQSGRKLRLKGRGVADPKTRARGDLFVRLLIHVPADGGERIREAVDALERAYRGDPRRDLRL